MDVRVRYRGSVAVAAASNEGPRAAKLDLNFLTAIAATDAIVAVGDERLAIGEAIALSYDRITSCRSHEAVVVFLLHGARREEGATTIDEEATCHIMQCSTETEARRLVVAVRERLPTARGRVYGSSDARVRLVTHEADADSEAVETRRPGMNDSIDDPSLLAVADGACARSSSSSSSVRSDTYVQDGPNIEESVPSPPPPPPPPPPPESRSVAAASIDVVAQYDRLLDGIRNRDLTAVTSLLNETPDLLKSPAEFRSSKDDVSARGRGQNMTAARALSAAICADSFHMVSFLLERGAHLVPDAKRPPTPIGNEENDEMIDPLILATRRGDGDLVRLLLRGGATPIARDRRGRTAMHWAAERRARDCVVALLEAGAPIRVDDDDGVQAVDLMPDLEGRQSRLVRDSLEIFEQKQTSKDPTALIRKRRRGTIGIDSLIFAAADPALSLGGGGGSAVSDEVKALEILTGLSRNDECLPTILAGLPDCIPGIILHSQLSWGSDMSDAVTKFMRSIRKATLKSFNNQGLLMQCALEFVQGGQEMQAEALCIIDDLIEANRADFTPSSSPSSSSPSSSCNFRLHVAASASSHRPVEAVLSSASSSSTATSSSSTATERTTSTTATTAECPSSPIDVLCMTDPSPLLHVLSSALAIHFRSGIGGQCAEGVNSMQLIVAKALAVASLSPTMQSRLAKEHHAKSLLEVLEKATNPVVIDLTLCILASLVENPQHHEALARLQASDRLRAFLQSAALRVGGCADSGARSLLPQLRHRVAYLLVALGAVATEADQLDGVYLFASMVKKSQSGISCFSIPEDDPSDIFNLRQRFGSQGNDDDDDDDNNNDDETSKQFVASLPNVLAPVSIIRHLTSNSEIDTDAFLDFFLGVAVTALHPVIFLRLLRHSLFSHPAFVLLLRPSRRRSSQNSSLRSGRRSVVSLSLPSGGGGGGGDDAWEGVAMPEFHRRVLRVLTEWMKRYGADVMNSSLAAEEVKHFMLDLQAVGNGYEVWVEHVNSLLVAQDVRLIKKKSSLCLMTEDDLRSHYEKLKIQILSDELPCPPASATKLASLQMIIETIGLSKPSQDEKSWSPSPGVALRHKSIHDIGFRLSKATLFSTLVGANKADYTTAKLKAYLPKNLARTRRWRDEVEKHHKLLAATFAADPDDTELRAMEQYVDACEQLPAYDCQLFRLKQITKKRKELRVFGLGTDQAIILHGSDYSLLATHPLSTLVLPRQRKGSGGTNESEIQIEFKSQEVYAFTSSKPVLKSLREAVQLCIRDIRGGGGGGDGGRSSSTSGVDSEETDSFDDTVMMRMTAAAGAATAAATRKTFKTSTNSSLRSVHDEFVSSNERLANLASFIGFPEEVARRLTEREEKLFRLVAPAAYVRHALIERTESTRRSRSSKSHTTVLNLAKRFGNVSGWVSRLVASAAKVSDRRVAISSLLRVAAACRNLGNLMGMMEVLTGLTSQHEDVLNSSLSPKDQELLAGMIKRYPVDAELDDLLDAMQRTREMNGGHVVPYYGWFLKRLRDIMASVPSIVLIPSGNESRSLERTINVNKLKRLREVLNKISLFTGEAKDELTSPSALPIDKHAGPDLEECEDSHVFLPIIPFACTGLRPHEHRRLLFGSTFIRWEDGGLRSTASVLKLYKCNSRLKYSPARWAEEKPRGRDEQNDANKPGDDDSSTGGMISFFHVKDIRLGVAPKDEKTLVRRHGINWFNAVDCCLMIVYGAGGVADVHYANFVAPAAIVRFWYDALARLLDAVRAHVQRPDQRPLWLRKTYHGIESQKKGLPTVSESCFEFGGRIWARPALTVQESFDCDSEVDLSRQLRKRYTSSTSWRAVASAIADGDANGSRRTLRKTDMRRVVLPALAELGDEFSPDRELDFASFCRLYDSLSALHRPDVRRLFDLFTSVDLNDKGDDGGGSGSENGDESKRHVGLQRKQAVIRMMTSSPATMTTTGTGSAATLPTPGRKLSRGAVGSSSPTTTGSKSKGSSGFSLLSVVQMAMSSPTMRSRAETGGVTGASDARQKWKMAAIAKRGGSGRNSAAVHVRSGSEPDTSELDDGVSAAAAAAAAAKLKRMKMNGRDLVRFMKCEQCETLTEKEAEEKIKKYETDKDLVEKKLLSYEGFMRMMLSDENYAYEVEKSIVNEDEMIHPLSHYYISSSHNTYLTGYQLRGESSVEIYRQILLSGCRCVELDCWDGDDGYPIITHGHTWTTKIKFKDVIYAINETAFVTSPYPLILSFENHCSIPKQQEMARICEDVFGSKLVKSCLFDTDYQPDPRLPSPEQLKYKILIKNKKKPPDAFSQQQLLARNVEPDFDDIEEELGDDGDDTQGKYGTLSRRQNPSVSGLLDDDSGGATEGTGTLSRMRGLDFRMSLDRASYDAADPMGVGGNLMSPEPTYKRQKETNKIADELSRLVIYTQAIKFTGLSSGLPTSISYPGGASGASGVSTTMLSSLLEDQSSYTPPSRRSSFAVPPPPTQRPRAASEVNAATISLISRKANDRKLSSPEPLPTWSSPGQRRPSICSRASSMNSSTGSSYDGLVAFRLSGSGSAPGSSYDLARMTETPRAFQMSSVGESTGKKLVKKQSNELVVHTELQLMRVYPAAKRIDSSNFNPLQFWLCGLQFVALNYQTEDSAMQLNRSMFSQNGGCGYVLKPYVYWSHSAPFTTFNPFESEQPNVAPLTVTVKVVSGQRLSSNFTTSVSVEVELTGVPTDYNKQKTKQSNRNALNPVWDETFVYKVAFRELAFVRFTVWESNSQTLLAQRVVPLRHLRQGYRHLRLHSAQDSPLEVATLFIATRMTEDYEESDDGTFTGGWDYQRWHHEIWREKNVRACPEERRGSADSIDCERVTEAEEKKGTSEGTSSNDKNKNKNSTSETDSWTRKEFNIVRYDV